jgi:DNA invertase Pin-like site-specific DNA recombinase
MQERNTPRAYAYSRISSAGSQLAGGGLDRQAASAREWCERNGFDLDETLHLSDPGRSGYSGDHLRRGALGRFVAMAQAGEIPAGSTLICEAVDRLSRQEPIESLQQVVFALVQAGIRIVDLEAGVTYDRESLRTNELVMLVLRAQAAHDFSRRLSRRISTHWKQGRERGRQGEVVRGQGGMRPFWIDLGDAGRWAFNDHATTVRLAFDLAQEMGTGKIAAELNARNLLTGTGSRWWASAVGSLLSNPATYGELVFGQKAHAAALTKLRRWQANPKGQPPVVPPIEVIEGYWPPVITREAFDRVQRMKKARTADRSISTKGVTHSWLQGIVECQAGGRMSATAEKPRDVVYRNLRCRRRRHRGGCQCGGKGWRLEQIHAHVLCRFPALTQQLLQLSHAGAEQDRDGHLAPQLERAQQQLAQAQGALRKAEAALAAAVDQTTSVALLERLSDLAEARQQEVRKAEAELARVQGLIDEEARRPDPAALLGSVELHGLVTTLATGEGTAAQRKEMNTLLRKIGMKVVLDDSRAEAPAVVITIGDSVPMSATFTGELEEGILRDLFPMPKVRGRARIVEEGGSFLILGC